MQIKTGPNRAGSILKERVRGRTPRPLCPFVSPLGNYPLASVPSELFMCTGASLSACPANLNVSQAMGRAFKRTEDLEDLHNAVRTLDRLLEPDHPPAY